jgi:hypothetical protein
MNLESHNLGKVHGFHLNEGNGVFFVNFALEYADLFKSSSRMFEICGSTSRNQYVVWVRINTCSPNN